MGKRWGMLKGENMGLIEEGRYDESTIRWLLSSSLEATC